jgi:hypothetical protein
MSPSVHPSSSTSTARSGSGLAVEEIIKVPMHVNPPEPRATRPRRHYADATAVDAPFMPARPTKTTAWSSGLVVYPTCSLSQRLSLSSSCAVLFSSLPHHLHSSASA